MTVVTKYNRKFPIPPKTPKSIDILFEIYRYRLKNIDTTNIGKIFNQAFKYIFLSNGKLLKYKIYNALWKFSFRYRYISRRDVSMREISIRPTPTTRRSVRTGRQPWPTRRHFVVRAKHSGTSATPFFRPSVSGLRFKCIPRALANST